MANAEQIVDIVESFLSSCPGRRAAGSIIADKIRGTFPSFKATDYGASNLREFLRQFAPRVKQSGLSGMDNVYQLITDGELGDPTPPVPPPHLEPIVLWRSFTSPNSPYKIYANATVSDIQLIPTSDPRSLDPPWHLIPSCDLEVHSQIAKEFIAEIPDEKVRAELDVLVASNAGTGPNSKYFETIHAKALDQKWLAFRRNALAKRFHDQFANIGFPLSKLPVIPPTTPALKSSPQIPAKATPSRPNNRSNDQLRRTALAVIENMSLDDIRKLRVPFGVMWDVIVSRKQ